MTTTTIAILKDVLNLPCALSHDHNSIVRRHQTERLIINPSGTITITIHAADFLFDSEIIAEHTRQLIGKRIHKLSKICDQIIFGNFSI